MTIWQKTDWKTMLTNRSFHPLLHILKVSKLLQTIRQISLQISQIKFELTSS